jgi:hypothetical protein
VRLVVVAFVEVELTVTRLVMVEVALFASIPPESVERPETVSEERVPRDVMFPWTAEGRVDDMDGAPAPLVINTPSFPVVIDESVLAEVVYRMVFVPPNDVTPVPPLLTAKVPVVSERAIPSDDVANCCHAPPAYEPRSTPAAEGFVMPVPPPPAPNRPARVLVNVRVFVDLVMVVEAVRPLNGVEEVARVIVGPVAVSPFGPIAVRAEVR